MAKDLTLKHHPGKPRCELANDRKLSWLAWTLVLISPYSS